jgi:two-component system, OmpR family, sensor kinase
MSLRARLVLAAAYLLAVVVTALIAPLGLSIQERAVSEIQGAALAHAGILSARVEDYIVQSGTRSGRVEIRRVVSSADRSNERIVVVNGSGAVLEDSADLARRGTLYATPQRPEFTVALEDAEVDTRRRFSDSLGETLLLVTVPAVEQGRVVGAVRLSQTLGSMGAEIRGTWWRLGALGVAVVGVGVALAWVLASTLVRPVHRLEAAATRLGHGDLTARAPTSGPSELSSLAASFNQTADALSANIVAQRDFLANASHQLRTPITGIKLRLEAIRDEGGFAARQAEKIELEVDRLSQLVDDLLLLARAASADSGGQEVDLASVARSAIERWRAPAEAAGQRVALEADEPCVVLADADGLAHILDNLIENAIRYSPSGSHVLLAVCDNGRPVLEVSDDGPGIPEDERARIFERFYRGSSGRASGPGSGLGLPIAAETIRRWGGEIRLLDGPGTRFQARFDRPPSIS